jgi:hypothetical protein
LTKVTWLRLRVVLDRDAFVARERPDHDLDLVLFDRLARGTDSLVGRSVRRNLDEFDLLAAGHAIVLFQRQIGAAHAVLPRRRERAFEGGQQADLQRLLRLREPDHRERRSGADEARIPCRTCSCLAPALG